MSIWVSLTSWLSFVWTTISSKSFVFCCGSGIAGGKWWKWYPRWQSMHRNMSLDASFQPCNNFSSRCDFSSKEISTSISSDASTFPGCSILPHRSPISPHPVHLIVIAPFLPPPLHRPHCNKQVLIPDRSSNTMTLCPTLNLVALSPRHSTWYIKLHPWHMVELRSSSWMADISVEYMHQKWCRLANSVSFSTDGKYSFALGVLGFADERLVFTDVTSDS